jgi:hypothetical protein
MSRLLAAWISLGLGLAIGVMLGLGLLALASTANAQTTVIVGGTGTSSAALGIVRTTTAVSSLVVLGRPGNVYSLGATIGGTGGFLLLYDAVADPGNGAQTPLLCVIAPANATVSLNWAPGPGVPLVNGGTLVFSTGANCLTETAANAFMWGTGAPKQ